MGKVCGSCGSDWVEGDRYCRTCGAPLGEPRVIPDAPAPVLYGPEPPKERAYRCTRCGFSWTAWAVTDEGRFCPRCGGSATGRELRRPEGQDDADEICLPVEPVIPEQPKPVIYGPPSMDGAPRRRKGLTDRIRDLLRGQNRKGD